MIAYLSGTLFEKNPDSVIVLAGGVGYEVHVPLSTVASLPGVGQKVDLRIYTQVREDAIVLFGFSTREEKAMFEKLISVSGIGPALGVKILGGMPVENLVIAVRAGDLAALTRISGVGKKTAERLVVELRDKMQDFAISVGLPAKTSAASSLSPLELDVVSALVNLGSAPPLAEQAVAKAKQEGVGADFEGLFRRALELVR
ncbi:MAG: Holliday junction branch migration protein RuvA [Bryobacter sp.]